MRRLRRDDRRQVCRDAVLWALLAISAIAMGPDPLRDLGAFGAVTVPRLALTALAVLVGRPWPLAAVVLLLPLGPWDFTHALATSNVTWLHPGATGVKLFPFGPISPFSIWYAYLAGRRLTRVLPAVAVGGAITLAGVGLVLAGGATPGLWITMLSGLIGTFLIPYLLGAVRSRMAHQQRQARQAAEAQARLRERARIARDMHDSLGHDLALIAVRAAGLELSPTLVPAHARAAGELRAAAAAATERLHQIIGVLRDDTDPAPLTPPPGHPAPTHRPDDHRLAPLTSLTRRPDDHAGGGPSVQGDAGSSGDVVATVERARASGLAITLRLEEPLPALAHALVREGLTNAAKHAPGAAVQVAVTPHRVVVRNGPPTRAAQMTASGGLGLTGLRERVGRAGGTLSAGPADAGYELAADLP
ncbi:sensor histidine kinase [Nonomuraea sp. NPDC048826]|uniref:sensor histidine kinase n=1 Tax=Nonomuraea sp. NPDC048826 TaxID=3364347 RepID=UPI003718C64E